MTVNMKAASSFGLSWWVAVLLLSGNESVGGGSGVEFAWAFDMFPPVRSSRGGPTGRQRAALYTATRSSSSGFKKRLDGDDEGVLVDEHFLEDDNGHINPELAQRLFHWEREQQINVNVRSQFSTRDGLRWVKELVSKMETSTSPKSDLIQEGVIELMQAMTCYEHEAQPGQTFESFAKGRIYRVLEDYQVKSKLAASTNSHRLALSVESTMEIEDPLETRYYMNDDDWEASESRVLDNGPQMRPDDSLEQLLDESIQYEGEDQMWVHHQQQIAAPLRDCIPDQESDSDDYIVDFLTQEVEGSLSLDDAALRDMILYDVDEFLGSTLNGIEAQVIQLRFGLNYLAESKTNNEVAFDLGISVNQVRKIQKQALEKLRIAYAKKYADDNASQYNHEDSA
jgi:RNA polymerase sigma factor (sigma-70 family)